MEEKEPMIGKTRKPILTAAIAIISIIAIAEIVVFLQVVDFKIKAFVLASVTIFIIMSVYSVFIYRKENSSQNSIKKLHVVIRIIWNYTIVISSMLVYYKISYSKHFIGDKSYWIYNLMQIHFIISLFLKYLIKLLKERKRLIEEKAGFPSHLLNVLYMVWMMLFLNFWGCYWLYIPKKTLDISNAPTPYVLYTYEYKYKHMDSLVGNTSRTIVIEDDKLLEDFTRELS